MRHNLGVVSIKKKTKSKEDWRGVDDMETYV